ncbi:MAG: DUF86 domain-containing protein [Bacteroidales bacterium]|nr:DUF86 domain-containing protein [Bacteroidales bacterium]
MREPARDPGRIEHILQAIDKIEEYTKDVSYEQFVSDNMRMHATIYNIQIIGEAAYKLTKEFKEKHNDIPWTLIEKMRHVLVHDYYRIVPDAVWDVVKSDIPTLKPMIEKLQ